MSIEKEIHTRFIKKGWTLALAESCTGGGLCSRFVALPDCSLYLQGAVVAYSNAVKEKILHVTTLETFGAVSESTALEMANGAREALGSTFAVATTGIAGPTGGSAEKPVGTVCFAIVSEREEPLSWTTHFSGSRKEIIESAIDDALVHLREYAV